MATITRETVEAVFKYKKKYPEMTMVELAVLCKTSAASTTNILNGMYNHLLEDTKKEEKRMLSLLTFLTKNTKSL